MASPAPIRTGDQLASTVCSTRVVVIRAPAGGYPPEVACGGRPMVPAASAPPAPPSASGAVTLIGKRYVNADATLELLCTASGSGELSCDGVLMVRKAAKALPASD